MTTHPFRKIFIHLLVYTLIILGIFAIQFRNQSIISKNFGQLRLSLSQPKNTSQDNNFKKSFTMTYKGLTVFANESNPISIKDSGKTQNIELIAWETLSDTSFELFFSHDISLLCGFTGQNKDIFTITYNGKEANRAELSIPYQISPSYTIMQSSPKRLILGGKTQQTVLNSAAIDENFIRLSLAENNLTYTNYVATKEYLFEESNAYELAKKELFDQTIVKLRKKMISSFDASDNISEAQVLAFLTEHLEQGTYKEGLSKVPQSFINSSRRSFASSPFLNSLNSMQRGLMMIHENMTYKMYHANETKKLDIFQAENFPLFLLTQNKDKITSFLQITNSFESFEPSVLEAAGIIETYLQLKEHNRSEAKLIENLLFICLNTIQKACELEAESLVLIEKKLKLDTESSLRVAKNLIDYGTFIKNKDIITTGYFIANSSLIGSDNLSAQSLANLYPILVKSAYYPQVKILSQKDRNPVWAWTSAKNISFETASDGTITIRIEFPVNQSHYVIIHNIEAFKAIEIYEMFFRTDPRFESYDSSGYVYDTSNKNLLLKVKNKIPIETIKLYYTDPVIETKPETETGDETTINDETIEQ